MTNGWSTYEDLIKAAAERYKISWTQLSALVQFESQFNPNAVSTAGAVGLGQIMPYHEIDFPTRPTKEELLDPEFNIDFTAQFWAAALTPREGDPIRAYSEVYNPGVSDEDLARFEALVQEWGEWDYYQEHPDEIPEGGVLPPEPYPRKTTERRAPQEPIQDAPPYYEGYWEDVERQRQIAAQAYNEFSAGSVELTRAQRTASFWNIFRPISILTGWRPPGVERPEPQYLIDWHKAQAAFRPIVEQYYLEQLKLLTYHYLPAGVISGAVLSPEDAIRTVQESMEEKYGDEAAMRAISPEYESFVTELFHKLSYLRYDPDANCEDLTDALTSPTRPRPMAFGGFTPVSELLRRMAMPTEPKVAEMGTFQEMRDLYISCGMELPEELLSARRQWAELNVQASDMFGTYDMIREGLVEPRLPSLTFTEELKLALVQPAIALLDVYRWYYRRWNAPTVTRAWETMSPIDVVIQRTPGGRPWELQTVPAQRSIEYEQLKSVALSTGMDDMEARTWAWENLNIPGVNRLVWELVFDPANILAALAGGVAGFVKGGLTGLGYEGIGKGAYVATLELMNAPNDLLAAPFLAAKQLWKALPKTPFQRSRGFAKAMFGEVDSYLVRAFPGKWPRMSAKETTEVLIGAIDDVASSPYATEALTPSKRAGYALTRASWRRIGTEEAIDIARQLGVPDPEDLFSGARGQNILDQMNKLWERVGLSEASGITKPGEAAVELLEILYQKGTTAAESATIREAAEIIWRNKQDLVIGTTKRMLRGKTPNSILRNWFGRVHDTAYKNYMDFDWRFVEGSRLLGRSLRVGDRISQIGMIQKMAGVNRRFASWVLYFPTFGPMNYLETAFRAHRMGVGLSDALLPSRQTFSELQTFAGLSNFPYEFRPGVAPPRLVGLLMGEPGENIIEAQARKSQILGRFSIPGVTKPARFPRDLIKRAPFLKRWNSLPEVFQMIPGSPAWNDWFGYVGQMQRAKSLLASFDRNLIEAAPDAMRAIDELIPPFTKRIEDIAGLAPREVEEISHGAWRAAQVGPEAIRGQVHDPNWYRRARFVQDVQEAAEHFPHLERDLVDEVVNMAERGEFPTASSVEDGFDNLMRAWKQGWIQKLDDSADRIRLVCSQIAAAPPKIPEDLVGILRNMETLMRLDLDVLSASKSAVTEAAHDVIQPAAKDAMHQTEYITRLMHQRQVGRATDYNFNLLESWIKGEAPPPMDFTTIPLQGATLDEMAEAYELFEKLPYDLQVHVREIFIGEEAATKAKRFTRGIIRKSLGLHHAVTGDVYLREIPIRGDLESVSTFYHEIAGHGWLGKRAMEGDEPFILDAIEAFSGPHARLDKPKAQRLLDLIDGGYSVSTIVSDPDLAISEGWRVEQSAFQEEFADGMEMYILAPETLRASNPKAHYFFDAHVAPRPEIPLTESDKARALSHIDYLREHQAIVYTTRDKISQAYTGAVQIYGRGKHWPAFLATEERLWNSAKVDLADLYMRKQASLHLEAASYDPLPRLEALTRPLTKGDLADALRITADQVRPVNLETYLLFSEEMFTAEVRAAAGAAGVAQGLADKPEAAADLLGYTKEEVGRVYRSLISELDIEPSTASAISPTIRSMAALRDEVKLAHMNRMISEEDVVKLNMAVEDLASRAEGVYPEDWMEIQEAAMGKARGEFELEHVDISDANVFDAFMKGTFPFWTYESQRWPWVLRTFMRSPHIATNLGRYMNYTDRGYIHIPGTDLRANPLAGTIFMGGFSRLHMRDYPEYFDTLPGISEPVGAMMRYGFYPGIIQSAFFVEVGAAARGKRPQRAEYLPAWGRTALDTFLAKYPDSKAAHILREQIFPDRYRDYYIMQMVDKIAFNRGLDIYGVRLWEKLEQDIKLTPEEQALWNEASSQVAKFGILSASTGWFTLRPEERKLAYEASAEMIEELTGIPRDLQEEAMRHYGVTGKRISDVYPLPPFEAYMLREVEEINRFVLSPYTTPLIPSGMQKQRIRTDQYWDEIETIWDTARHTGWIEEGYMSLDYLEQAFTVGTAEYPSGMSAGDYIREVGRTMEYASSVSDRLGETEYYRYSMETHDGVPKSLEERADYYEHHGIPMPTYHPIQELLYAYYDLTPELKFNEDTGAMERDFDSYYAMSSALLESIPESSKPQFTDRLMAKWTPMRKLHWAVSREFFSPYRNIREMIIDERPEEQQSTIRQYSRATDPKRDELREVVDEQGLGIISQFQDDLRTARRNARLAYPEMDAWLLFWGRTQSTLTPAAQQMYENLIKRYRPAVVIKEDEME